MLVGAVYGLAVNDGELSGASRGGVTGIAIAAPLFAVELFLLTSSAGVRLRRLPFFALITLKSVVYFLFILIGQVIGIVLFPTAEAPLLTRYFWSTIFSAGASFAINFVVQIDGMLGQGELWRFILGRYHRPRREERIFLFLDLVGSTGLAERLGDTRLFELLDALYADIAAPISDHEGAIHKYVGDEVIVAWPPERGLPEGRVIACAFAIAARVAARAPAYRTRYGVAPRFRMGLHMGEVVVGELGSDKREIAYLGDAVNTAARLVDACRELGHDCIASAPLLGRTRLPNGIHAEPLGAVPLRGKEAEVLLFALARTDVAPHRRTRESGDPVP